MWLGVVSSPKEIDMWFDELGPTKLGALAELFGPSGGTILAVLVVLVSVLAMTVFIRIAEAMNEW